MIHNFFVCMCVCVCVCLCEGGGGGEGWSFTTKAQNLYSGHMGVLIRLGQGGLRCLSAICLCKTFLQKQQQLPEYNKREYNVSVYVIPRHLIQ